MENRGYNCYVAPTSLGTWIGLVPLDSRRHYAAKLLLHCCCSVTKSCLTLCDPMDYSTPDFPVPHHLPEFAQVHVHCIGDAIQPSHLLHSIFPNIRVFPIESLFTSCGQSTAASVSASVLPVSTLGSFPLRLTGWISLQSKGISRVFSSTTVQKHQLFGAQLSLWCSSHNYTWLLERPQPWLYGPLSAKYCLFFFF